MSDRPNVIVHNNQAPTPRSNGLGVAGFVISLIGILTCAGGIILCPLGLILSACGMRKEPRGLAITGFVLGLLRSIVPIVMILVFGVSIYGAMFTSCMGCLGLSAAATAVGHNIVVTNQAIDRAQVDIIAYTTAHAGALPADADGTAEIVGETDAWTHRMRYTRLSPTQYEIRSEGQDGIFGTADDVSRKISTVPTTETQPDSQPEQNH